MSKGTRLGLVWASQLMWSEDADPQQFVESGTLGDAEEEVLPFNPQVRSEIVKAFQGS
jgi:hypothetical protein